MWGGVIGLGLGLGLKRNDDSLFDVNVNINGETKTIAMRNTIANSDMPLSDEECCGWFFDEEFTKSVEPNKNLFIQYNEKMGTVTSNAVEKVTLYTRKATPEKLAFTFNQGTNSYIVQGKSPEETIGEVVIPRMFHQSGETESKPVDVLANGAFQDYSGLTVVYIPSSVTEISDSSLSNATLTTVNIHDAITSIGNSAFSGSTGLTKLEIGSSVESIGSYAFDGCTGLTGELIIPNSVTSIESDAFSNCTGLTSMYIPSSVTTISVSSNIHSPFYGCSNRFVIYCERTEAEKPEGWGEYWNSYNGYYNKLTVEWETSRDEYNDFLDFIARNPDFIFSGTKLVGYIGTATDVVIPTGTTHIGNNAFKDLTTITSVSIPDTVTSIGDSAFFGCTGLTGKLITPNSVKNIGAGAFSGCAGLTGFVIGSSVESIGNGAFRGCTGLTEELIIPNSVKSIEASAFYRCTGLTGFVIGSSVESIGVYAFERCTGLTTIYIPSNVTTIHGSPFKDCSNNLVIYCECTEKDKPNGWSQNWDYGCYLDEYNNNTNFAVVWGASQEYYDSIPVFIASNPDFIFYGTNVVGYTGTATDVVIPTGTTHIGNNAFKDLTTITSVSIPDTVMNIGYSAFFGCTGLTGELTISNGVKSIGINAFKGCSKLDELIIGTSVESISTGAFESCTGLTGKLIIPNSVKNIGESAFYKCDGLTGIVIGSNVEIIGGGAFYECTGITGKLIIPNSVMYIGGSAFYRCTGLTGRLIIPNSVKSINNKTFGACTGLTEVVIGSGVESIENKAFDGCVGLRGVYIPSSVTLISAKPAPISGVGDSPYMNSPFYGCSGVIYCECTEKNKPKGWDIYWNYSSSGELPVVWGVSLTSYELRVSNPDFTFDETTVTGYVGTASDVIIPYGTTAIGNEAFKDKTTITSVTISNTVTSIGNGAFSGCTGLTSVYIPSSVTTIDPKSVIPDFPFYKCSNNLVIYCECTEKDKPEGWTRGWNYYSDNDNLSVVWGVSLEEYNEILDFIAKNPDFIFHGRSVVGYTGTATDVVIPTGTIAIGNNAFKDLTTITRVTLPDTVKRIGESAFEGCNGLTEIVSSSIESIGNYAFRNCIGLTEELIIPNSVISIGNGAFYGCTGLKSVYIPSSVISISSISYSPFYNCSSNLVIYCEYTEKDKPEGWWADWNRYSKDGKLPVVWGVSLEEYNEILDFIAKNPDFIFHGRSVVGYTGTATDVVIPTGTTAIGNNAFKDLTTITSISIPNTITSIGSSAFEGCTGLAGKLIIPNSVTVIGNKAFYGCTELTEVVISSNLEKIERETFSYCTGLTNMYIPSSVTTIYNSPFYNCSSNLVIYCECTEKNKPQGWGSEWNMGNSGSLSVVWGVSLEEYNTIMDFVNSNPDFIFHGMKLAGYTGTATDVVIPTGTTHIENNAFKDLTTITSVSIPDTVTSIGNSAFSGCTGLNELVIGSSVESIGSYAFKGCTGLTGELIIPNSVKRINSSAFYECTGLTSVYIPSSVKEIYGEPFYYCSSSLVIYCENANKGTGWSSDWCHSNNGTLPVVWDVSLEEYNDFLDFSAKNPDFIFHGRSVVGYTGTATEVVIPYGTTSIEAEAFKDKSTITSVTIPDTINSIAFYAFNGCTGLTSVFIPSSVKIITNRPFLNCSSDLIIYCECTEADKPQGWGAFDGYTEGVDKLQVVWGVSREEYESSYKNA